MVESRQVGINRVVVGSSPTSGAIFVEETKDTEPSCKEFAQKKARNLDKRVTSPSLSSITTNEPKSTDPRRDSRFTASISEWPAHAGG